MTTSRVISIGDHKCRTEKVEGYVYIPSLMLTKKIARFLNERRPQHLRELEQAELQAKKRREHQGAPENERLQREKKIKHVKEITKKQHELQRLLARAQEQEHLELEISRVIARKQRELEDQLNHERKRELHEIELARKRSSLQRKLELQLQKLENEMKGYKIQDGKKGLVYIVATVREGLGKFKKLSDAKKTLTKFKRNSKQARAIFEVVNGKVRARPLLDGNKFWWDEFDLNRMLKQADNYNEHVKQFGSTRTLLNFERQRPEYYIVVADDVVIGEYTRLRVAKKVLMHYSVTSKIRRAIFQVVEGEVSPNPNIVGGHNQAVGLENEFNKYWKNRKDITRMLSKAREYVRIRDKDQTENDEDDVSGTFIAVTENKVVGMFHHLEDAKLKLARVGKNNKQSRCIFEIRNQKVQKNTLIVAGESQVLGMRAGFNKLWWGSGDIRHMYKIANIYHHQKQAGYR